MTPPKEFTQNYYDKKYFADPKGKEFKRENGSVEHWGYRNPKAEFMGAKEITAAWKTMVQPENMLDVGCGRGTFIAYARDIGIEAEGFDFSEWAINNPYERCRKEWLKIHDATYKWGYPPHFFDVVVALDFYEHIYELDLEFVISEMYRVAKNWIFLQIATVDGVKEHGYILRKREAIPLDKDARTWAGHVTVCTEQWWIDRLEHDDWMLRRDMKEWFCSLVDPSIIKNWLLNTILVLEHI